MSSGGGGGGNTTTTTELPDWAQPYAQDLLQRGNDLSNTTVPQYTGQTVASLSQNETSGLANQAQATNNAGSIANNATNLANRYSGSTGPQIANPYTGNLTASNAAASYADPSNNPYLANTMAATNQAITQAYNSSTAPQTLAQFRDAGAFGGSAQQQATANNEYQLGNALGNADAAIGSNAYNTGAGVASQNAAQANMVGMSNQAIGTNANNAFNQNVSSNYFNNGYLGNTLNNGATLANSAYGTQAGNELTGGAVAQQNNQDQLDAAYQKWYNQVNQPYSQLSTLSSALSGALGSGAGTSISKYNSGGGNTLGTLLGLGSIGAGIYGMM